MNDKHSKRLTFDLSKEQYLKLKMFAIDNFVSASEVIRCFVDSIEDNEESYAEMLFQQAKKRVKSEVNNPLL